MNKKFKEIKKQIKKYPNIVIARHIGPDPDAVSSQIALRDLIKEKYPDKKVYAIGSAYHRFKFLGTLDKIEEVAKETLLIVLDTPDIKRIDGININDYSYIIKIDHHPFIEKFANIEYIDDTASSTAQIILEFIFDNKWPLTKNIAKKLYAGIISDTNRFLYSYTTLKTFKLVTKLLEKTKISFLDIYPDLYAKPLNEIKLQGYIYQNLKTTENGVAYIKLTDEIIKELEVDSGSAGNMISDLNYINNIFVWVFFTEDKKNNQIRVNLRSRGPYINELAAKYGGGGHKHASGARLNSWSQADDLINDLDNLVKNYIEEKK